MKKILFWVTMSALCAQVPVNLFSAAEEGVKLQPSTPGTKQQLASLERRAQRGDESAYKTAFETAWATISCQPPEEASSASVKIATGPCGHSLDILYKLVLNRYEPAYPCACTAAQLFVEKDFTTLTSLNILRDLVEVRYEPVFQVATDIAAHYYTTWFWKESLAIFEELFRCSFEPAISQLREMVSGDLETGQHLKDLLISYDYRNKNGLI